MGMSSAFIVLNPEAKGSPSLLFEEFLSVMKKYGVRTSGDELCGIDSMVTLKKVARLATRCTRRKRYRSVLKCLQFTGITV